MKLCTFAVPTLLGLVPRVGVVDGDQVVDATAARIALLERTLPPQAAARVGTAQVPPDMVSLLGTGGSGLQWVREALDHIALSGQHSIGNGISIVHGLHSVNMLAPVQRPPGIACFITWSAHIEDSQAKGFAMMKFPDRDSDLRAYYKANPDAVEPPGTTIPLPPYAEEMDVECEMAAVIGVGGRDLSREQAHAAIAGYTIFNDVSYRRIQREEMVFGLGPTKGKDADHSNVLGPWLVTADEVGDPHDLEMAFLVNGATIGSYHTSKMAWNFADLVSYLSRGQTLMPGQVITSGAFPGGCGLDASLALKSGDVVEMRVERLGTLMSTIG